MIVPAQQHTSAIVIFGAELETQNVTVLEHAKIPLVVVDASFPYHAVHTISINNEGAIFSGVNHLYRLEHCKIGYLHSTANTSAISERSVAYANALEILGLSYDPSLVFPIAPS